MDSDATREFDWGEDFDGEQDADVLRFEVAGMSFAVAAELVTEVAHLPAITRLPSVPPHVLGVAVRRRKVLGLLDVATFLGLPPSRKFARLLVLDVEGLEVGIAVDATSGLESWPDDPDAPLSDLAPKLRKYAIGSHWAPGGRVVLLDFPSILQDAAVV